MTPSTAKRDSSASVQPAACVQLRLLQLCSPALPIGAFAYSQGLEQAVERDWVTDVESLEDWLSGILLHPLAHTDLPLLARARTAWLDAAPEARAIELSELVLAHRESKELREEERQLGSSLARVLARLDIPEAAPHIGSDRASYVVMFALGAARWQIPATDALSGFAFAWLENQLAAASRLLRLGQLDAQGVLSRLLQQIPRAVERALSLGDAEIGQALPAWALASAWHQDQYSRLFRS